MKKFIAVWLALLTLTLTMAACNPTTPEETSTKEESTTEAPVVETTAEEETTMEATTEEETTMAEETTLEETTTEETSTEETTTEAPKTYPVLYQIMPHKDVLQNCYLIKTANGKYILIDGGDAGQDAVRGYLYRQLSDIMEIRPGQAVEIEAWFLTHMHDDHVTEFTMMPEGHRFPIKVNNVYMNFPSREFMNQSEGGASAHLYDGVQAAYDRFIGEGEFEKTGGKTAFTGDVIEIDGVKIEILMTVTDEETESNINDTSMIFRVTMEGQTILFLGDAYIPEGNRLLQQYGKDLKSDIVQMAHHGQNGVSREVYEAIDPTMCLWPTPIWVFENNAGIYQTDEVRSWMADMDVKYHIVAGEHLTQSLTFPVDFDSLTEYPIRKVTN